MSEANTYSGRVIHVGQTEQISEKFKKRVLVVTDGHAEYPQKVPFTFVQNNVEKLDNVKEGDEVTVTYELRGREWEGKYFSDIQGWKLDVKGSAPTQPKSTSEKEAAFENAGNDGSDDLPF